MLRDRVIYSGFFFVRTSFSNLHDIGDGCWEIGRLACRTASMTAHEDTPVEEGTTSWTPSYATVPSPADTLALKTSDLLGSPLTFP